MIEASRITTMVVTPIQNERQARELARLKEPGYYIVLR